MIIGITGKAQSGKDTACRIVQLINTVDYDCACLEGEGEKYILDNVDSILPMTCMWEKHAFADKLKECASTILGVPRFMFESGEFKESFTSLPLSNKEGEPMTNREFLQYFGTEVGRSIDKDLWIKALMYSYGRDKESHWIVPDVRFPNEADAIRNAGGVLWKIERDGSGAGNHISEKLIDDIMVDIIIENNLDMKYYIKAITLAYNDTMNMLKR
jgi:hypothetical protein|nr:MAG TPA: deoxynucleoside monophosphate kinase [Bacteriophage sp.]